MRLVQVQQVEAANAARIAGGHACADIDVVGEPNNCPTKPCSCGAVCHSIGYRCRGQATVVVPSAVVELHACAVHLVEYLDSMQPWWSIPADRTEGT